MHHLKVQCEFGGKWAYPLSTFFTAAVFWCSILRNITWAIRCALPTFLSAFTDISPLYDLTDDLVKTNTSINGIWETVEAAYPGKGLSKKVYKTIKLVKEGVTATITQDSRSVLIYLHWAVGCCDYSKLFYVYIVNAI